MLNGLDLFSGIGGISLALREWVKPVAYCEIDRYAQAVLLSRMHSGQLPRAPIWDDIRTLFSYRLPSPIDIISGGFPCQDISCAGNGVGLEGERSGLFFEIIRLVGDLRPRFVFLENVPAITTRGGVRVISEFAALGYDCRWTIVSAADVGALHLRKRWWLLAHANDARGRQEQISEFRQQDSAVVGNDGKTKPLADTKNNGSGRRVSQPGRGQTPGSMANTPSERCAEKGGFRRDESSERSARRSKKAADTDGERLEEGVQRSRIREEEPWFNGDCWWSSEPSVGRVVNGLPDRAHRIRGLGNAVVPIQAREAFKRLIGIEE